MTTQTIPARQDSLLVLQAARDEAKKTKVESEANLKAADEKLKLLDPALEGLGKNTEALTKQREAFDKAMKDAETVYAAVLGELKTNLSEPHRIEVDAVIKKIDDAVSALRTEAGTLATEVTAAEKAATEAKEKAASAKASFATAQTQLDQLPAQMTAAKEKVVKAQAAMKAAFDGGKLTEAYFLAKELEAAVAAAKAASDPAVESNALAQLTSRWNELSTANETASTTAKELEGKKRSLADKEQALQKAIKDREATIRKELDKLTSPQVSSAPAAGGNP